MHWTRALGVAALLAVTLRVVPASAAGEDPDWPCVQRLVPQLSAGQMWTGLPLDELPAGVVAEPALATLPGEIARRAVPVEKAAERVAAALAAVPDGPKREEQRALLFRDTLAIINAERGDLVAGIKRSARRQRQLAEKVTASGRRLEELRADPAQAAAFTEASAERDWDMRVFDERQRSLTSLCDQPVLLEQRAFALARAIKG